MNTKSAVMLRIMKDKPCAPSRISRARAAQGKRGDGIGLPYRMGRSKYILRLNE